MSEVTRQQPAPKAFPAWKSVLTWCVRLLLGATFIFSGFVKATDPWGTVYKLQEYLQALGIGSLTDACLPLAFLLFAVEFMTGVSILLGCYRRLSVWTAALFMAFMLPLTLWIALKNPVADCGCFGDALPLSNWATFRKNILLTALTVWLLVYNTRSRCLITPALQWIAFCLTAIFITAIGWTGYYYQPLIDFRPYPVGTAIVSSDASDDSGEMKGIYERNGQRITLPLDSIPDDSWTFVGRETAPASKAGEEHAQESAAALYDPYDEEDVTAEVLHPEGDIILIVAPSLKRVSTSNFYRLNSLYNYAAAHNADIAAITSATPAQVDDFKDLSLAEYPVYLADESWMKELARGNPAIVMVRNGRIMWKSTLSALTPNDFLSADAPSDPALFARRDSVILAWLCVPYGVLMALLIAVSFTPAVLRRLRPRRNPLVRQSALLALTAALSLASASCSKHNEEDEPIRTQRVESATLIYMVANNSLNQNADSDIQEILEGCRDIDLNKNAVMVFLSSPQQGTALYRARSEKSTDSEGNESRVVTLKRVKDYGSEADCVSPDLIAGVMADFRKAAQADTYGLFLWSHATGWLPSYRTAQSQGPRKAFGDDYGRAVNIDALADALPDGMFRYIWFDCCLMGGVETCYAMRRKGELIVASPTEIMAQGAPYHLILPLLARRNPSVTEAARTEFDYYNRDVANSMGFTIAVVDASRMEPLALAAREIAAPSYPFISTTSLQAYGYHTVSFPDGTRTRVPFYDLQQTFSRYAEERGKNFDSFKSILASAVLYKGTTVRFGSITIDTQLFSGLSVHVPLPTDAPSYNMALESFYMSLSWPEFITRR